MISKGIYRHFKGELYKVTGIVSHSETEERLVLYHNLNSPDNLWVRPLDMFTEVIERDGNKIQRFQFISEG